MLDIPKDMKRKNPWMLIALMGVAVTCFILAANALVAVAVVMAEGSQLNG